MIINHKLFASLVHYKKKYCTFAENKEVNMRRIVTKFLVTKILLRTLLLFNLNHKFDTFDTDTLTPIQKALSPAMVSGCQSVKVSK